MGLQLFNEHCTNRFIFELAARLHMKFDNVKAVGRLHTRNKKTTHEKASSLRTLEGLILARNKTRSKLSINRDVDGFQTFQK